MRCENHCPLVAEPIQTLVPDQENVQSSRRHWFEVFISNRNLI